MTLPVRKTLRLYNRSYSGNGAYFVTICTKDKACILSSIEANVGDGANNIPCGKLDVPRIVLTKTGKIVEKYILSGNRMRNIRVDEYIIMPNHVHIIIVVNGEAAMSGGGTSRAPSPTNEEIPRFVGAFKRMCSREIGVNIFQRSYYDRVIRDDDEYAYTKKYMRMNPTRWLEKQNM